MRGVWVLWSNENDVSIVYELAHCCRERHEDDERLTRRTSLEEQKVKKVIISINFGRDLIENE